MDRRWLRLVPVLLVGVLLAVAALLPSRRAGARPEPRPVPDAIDFANCGTIIQQGGYDGTVGLAYYNGVDQPIIPETNVLSCSLGVQPTDGSGLVTFVQWDPVALLPDPTSIALRARAFGISDLYYSPILIGWSPPIVVRRAAHLAEPPRGTVAMDFLNNGGFYGDGMRYQYDGAHDVPIAYLYGPFSGNARGPLPGAHPVLSQVMCGGDSALQSLVIAQSVVTTNTLRDTASVQVMQRFRVPAEIQLRWVELAFGTVVPRTPFLVGSLAIFDATGMEAPPVSPGTPLISAYLKTSTYNPPVWDSNLDFDHVIALEPDHDYWLMVGTGHCYGLYSRTRTGTESADFVSAIGGLYARATAAAAWSAVSGQTLCFKIVGQPTGVGGAPAPQPDLRGLRLGVSPNPARGVALVRWSGAVGSVRFEVLDARGRRVGAGSGQSGATGGWTWRAAAADGAALPAGVYFVRATDGAGRRAVERVVVVR